MYAAWTMPNKGAFRDDVKNRTTLASSALHGMDNKTITNHHRVNDRVKYRSAHQLPSLPRLLSFAASPRQQSPLSRLSKDESAFR